MMSTLRARRAIRSPHDKNLNIPKFRSGHGRLDSPHCLLDRRLWTIFGSLARRSLTSVKVLTLEIEASAVTYVPVSLEAVEGSLQ
jgi:hypothetical protein